MGGFFSSPESNSSVQVEEMGASGSKANATVGTVGTVGTAAAPRMNGVNKNVEAGEAGNRMNVSAMAPRTTRANNNVEMGTTQRVNTNGSDPGTPGRNNGNNRNKSRRNNAAINVNRLKNVVVEEPPQENASTNLQGENMAGGRRRHRKGSRKASRKQGHKSRRH
jgi:hypothetical protein